MLCWYTKLKLESDLKLPGIYGGFHLEFRNCRSGSAGSAINLPHDTRQCVDCERSERFWCVIPHQAVVPGGLLVALREAIKKKKFIFSDFVQKGEGGSRTKPIFYIRIIWDPTLREGGAKFLFPKSKLLKDLNKNWLSQT